MADGWRTSPARFEASDQHGLHVTITPRTIWLALGAVVATVVLAWFAAKAIVVLIVFFIAIIYLVWRSSPSTSSFKRSRAIPWCR